MDEVDEQSKVSHHRGRSPVACPCRHCGDLTNEHVYGDQTAECDDCLRERGTPWCPDCGRDHHGDCGSALAAEALGESVAESAARYLAERSDA